MFVFILC